MILPHSVPCALLLGAALHAQSGASGSESHLSPARGLDSSGGAASGSTYLSEVEISALAGGPVTSSESFVFRGGTVWSGNGLAPTAPLALGISPPLGSKDGGASAIVQGLGFQAPGAGATTATLGGQPAAVSVLSNTQLGLVTPPGVDAFGNPLGRAELVVTNALGTGSLPEAYVYTPAVVIGGPARLGEALGLSLHAKAGDLVDLYLGFSIPGVALPVPPLDGALELLAFSASPFPSSFASTDTTSWSTPVPNSPSLVGISVEFQGFALDSIVPLGGSFTNRAFVTITE